MHIKFSCSYKFNIYLQQVIQQKLVEEGRDLGPPLNDYFLKVRTSLELWASSDLKATTIAFFQASSFTFFWASYSFLRVTSFFLLVLIYQVSDWLSFLTC
jgi:hypothetical protein